MLFTIDLNLSHALPGNLVCMLFITGVMGIAQPELYVCKYFYRQRLIGKSNEVEGTMFGSGIIIYLILLFPSSMIVEMKLMQRRRSDIGKRSLTP